MRYVYVNKSSILLLIIFKEENLNYQWISINNSENWYYACNFKGWMNDDHAMKWLQKCFESMTHEKMNDMTWLLIYDDHENHIISRFLSHCLKHDIQVILLLPHTSHLLQPFDIDIFNLLKYYLS